jgi:small-conductance mechanosensitive channel
MPGRHRGVRQDDRDHWQRGDADPDEEAVMGVSKVLILIAVILFVLAAFGLPAIGTIGTVALGLAFYAAASLVP